jgi:hypothetical protein
VVCFAGARPCSSAEWRLTTGHPRPCWVHVQKASADESMCAIHALVRTHPDRRAADALRTLCIKPWNHREIRNFNGN